MTDIMSQLLLQCPGLTEALGYMHKNIACPEEARTRIRALRVPADEVHGTRGFTSNWRQGAAAGGGGLYGSSGRWPGGGGAGGSGGSAGGRRYAPTHSRTFVAPPRFGNKAREDVTTEERMMDRIRDKMNKFSPMTYDATKAWLTQLLDSGETDFLKGFITLVFEKAAAEPPFCAVYARLLTELRQAFPHLDVELRRIFGEFQSIFVNVSTEPDVASSAYSTFVEQRERRKYRRGYAAFLGEITRLGVLNIEDIICTATVILDGLDVAKITEGAGLLTEEYADCLGSLINCCKDMIDGSHVLVTRIRAAQTKAPSLTNKARFALMDISDLFDV